jgi:hypothetical protein
MISMTYALRGETIRFVWRNIRFAFAGFGLHFDAKRNGAGRGRRAQGASDRGPLSARSEGQKPPIREARRSPHRDPLESRSPIKVA